MSLEPQTSDEIDLLDLLTTLWEGKWLISGISGLAFAAGGAYVAIAPNSFDATLLISPINSTLAAEYEELNQIGVYEISPGTLINLMAEVLLEREVFVEEIRRLGLVDRNQFTDEQEYERAIRRQAFEVSITTEDTDERAAPSTEDAIIAYSRSLTLSGDDQDATEDFLIAVIQSAEAETRTRLSQVFEQRLIASLKSQSHAVEDIERSIEDAFEDYEVRLQDRLQFLQEQAQIARALNVARNTLEITSFTRGNSTMANVDADTPFYMRGYEAIEKEIELLQSRGEPDAFVPDLREMQSTKRLIERDPTPDRAQAAFNASPAADPDRFRSVQYDIAALEITYHKKTSLILALSLVLGSFMGMATVLVRGAMKSRQRQTLNK